MLRDLTDRVLEEGYYIAQTGATVRKTAEVFHYSKSTVHKDVTERLMLIDKDLAEKVRVALEINLKERHVRGGEATRIKFLKLKNKS